LAVPVPVAGPERSRANGAVTAPCAGTRVTDMLTSGSVACLGQCTQRDPRRSVFACATLADRQMLWSMFPAFPSGHQPMSCASLWMLRCPLLPMWISGHRFLKELGASRRQHRLDGLRRRLHDVWATFVERLLAQLGTIREPRVCGQLNKPEATQLSRLTSIPCSESSSTLTSSQTHNRAISIGPALTACLRGSG
jgi:hypothetical protein